MKTLGIIGGIAPPSTIEYYRMLFESYRSRRPDGSAPLIIINSIDNQTMLRLIAADALDALVVSLAADVDKLARAGADIGLLASNTPHLVFDELARRSSIPLISIVETAYAAARSAGLTRAGLLGTRFTMQGTAYPRVFARGGIALVVPDEPDLTWVHDRYMGELVKGEYRPETRAGLLDIIARLRTTHAIDGVILGGTELPLIMRDVGDIGIPMLDTGRIHVEAAIERMLG